MALTKTIAGSAPTVFISSTTELWRLPRRRPFVSAARDAARRAVCASIDMFDFLPQNMPPADYCEEMVAKSDVYVCVLGHRYGSPVRGRPGLSYTELEFETATRLGLHRLVFVIDDRARLRLRAKERPELAERQRQFRRRVIDESGLLVAHVRTPEELESRLFDALRSLPGTSPLPPPPTTETTPSRPAATSPSRKRKRAIAALAALTAVGVLALLVSVAPNWLAPLASNRVIGDERTADPCALARPAQQPLAQFGDVEFDSHYGNFSRCDLIVHRLDGTKVDVAFRLLKPIPPEHVPTTTVGSVTIARETAANGECDRVLSMPDPHVVEIAAKVPPGQSADLCRIADVAAHAAVPVLNRGKLETRDLPAGSLAALDACRLLDAPALALSGIDAGTPRPGFGGWECSWGAAGRRSVTMSFDQGPPLSAPHDGSAIQVGSRTAFVHIDGDGPRNNCVVQIPYRSFSAGGSPLVEVVRLVLGGQEASETLCEPARNLAADAAANLPG
jgi:Domain of unknown function (DUF4062)